MLLKQLGIAVPGSVRPHTVESEKSGTLEGRKDRIPTVKRVQTFQHPSIPHVRAGGIEETRVRRTQQNVPFHDPKTQLRRNRKRGRVIHPGQISSRLIEHPTAIETSPARTRAPT